MKLFLFGKSELKRPIFAYEFGPSDESRVVLLGGVHGDETEGVDLALGLLEKWQSHYPFRLNLVLVPMLNVDGVLAQKRVNARGVDLNRNLPTRDWTSEVKNPRYPPGPSPASESENQALIRFLKLKPPIAVFSFHSWKPLLNVNGPCEPFASAIQSINGYPIEPSIGYPTPGCLGTYTGLEMGIPTLTYELERGLSPSLIFDIHVQAVEAGLHSLQSQL